ncbi:hypothetical protein ACWGVR_36815 [Streptomyces xanthophaeus]
MGVNELTALIMPAVTGLAGGVGSGLGTAAAEEVRRLARERLGASEEGRAALARLDEEPVPAEAEEGVRERLTAELTNDPAFARLLQQAAQRPEFRAGGDINSITIGGGVKGSTITIGPVTLQKTPGVMAALGLFAAALALLVGFGGYGVVQVLRADDGPAASSGAGQPGGGVEGAEEPAAAAPSGSGGPEDKRVTAIKDLSVFEAVLPTVQSMPRGWSSKKSDRAPDSAHACSRDDCKGELYSGSALFTDSGVDAMFRASAYDSARTAVAGYASLVKVTEELPDTTPMSLDPVGDESTAFSADEYTGSATIHTMGVVIRVGTVVARIDYGNSYDPPDPADLVKLAELIAERAQQAQNGRPPNATARR